MNSKNQNECAHINIASWNINGITNKLNDSVLLREICSEDIVIFCETHCKADDSITVPGFKTYQVNRKSCLTGKGHGGVAVERDVYLCAIYIPPANSSYCNVHDTRTTMDTLNQYIVKFNKDGFILLAGDLNA